MIDARLLDEIARNFSDNLGKVLPAGASQLKTDFEHNARAALQSTLGKMDLVSREEFDVQTAVLRKTRERLQELEQRLEQLEQNRH